MSIFSFINGTHGPPKWRQCMGMLCVTALFVGVAFIHAPPTAVAADTEAVSGMSEADALVLQVDLIALDSGSALDIQEAQVDLIAEHVARDIVAGVVGSHSMTLGELDLIKRSDITAWLEPKAPPEAIITASMLDLDAEINGPNDGWNHTNAEMRFDQEHVARDIVAGFAGQATAVSGHQLTEQASESTPGPRPIRVAVLVSTSTAGSTPSG